MPPCRVFQSRFLGGWPPACWLQVLHRVTPKIVEEQEREARLRAGLLLGRRAAGLQHGLQASHGSAGGDGREDGDRAQSRARHCAQCHPELEAVRRGEGDDDRGGRRPRRSTRRSGCAARRSIVRSRRDGAAFPPRQAIHGGAAIWPPPKLGITRARRMGSTPCP